MFREMRRKRQQLSQKESMEVLQRGSSGVLALTGDEGYPYTVPISYVTDGESIYFHSATEGHKIDAVRRNSKASFCVIDMDMVLPERFTTCYRSVVAFGQIRIVEDPQELLSAIKRLAEKYSAPHMDRFDDELKAFQKQLCLLRFDIEHLTGKQAKELKK